MKMTTKLILSLKLSCLAISAIASVPKPHTLDTNEISTRSDAMIPLMLEVHINNSQVEELMPFFQDNADKIYVQIETLKRMRIEVNHETADSGLIQLAEVDNLHYRYDINNQEIYISLPIRQLKPYEVDMSGNQAASEEYSDESGLTTAILNYDLYHERTGSERILSGEGEILLNSNAGNFVSSGIYNSNSLYTPNQFVRLNTYWQLLDASDIRSFILGDFTSNAVDWSNSIRMAGLQISSAYKQRPDIITAALPQFSGSVALPSSLDLYINQQKIFAGEVPSGPFDIRMFPFVSGNEVTLMTRDALGREITSTHTYYYSPKILRKGIKEFSFDIGIPRYNYGINSDNYGHDLYSSASLHYGLNSKYTLTGHAEYISTGLVNLGAGLSQSIFDRGVFSINAAQSKYKNMDGTQIQLGLEGRITRNLTFNVNSQHSIDNYYDFGRAALLKYNEHQHRSGNDLSITAKSLSRYGLTYTPVDGISLSGYLNSIKYHNEKYDYLTLNLSSDINENISLYGSFYKDLNNNDDRGAYIGLRINMGENKFSTTSIQKEQGRNAYTQEFTGLSNERIGSFGWGMSTTHYEHRNNMSRIRGDYHSPIAYFTGQYSQYGSISQTRMSASGSLITTGDEVFSANKIGDGFIIVKNAGPNSTIRSGGVNMGESNTRGSFLLANVTPYIAHHIYLDPTNLPLEWQPKSTEKTAITGYRRGTIVDFETSKSSSITAVVHTINNHPVSPGYKVSVNGKEQSIVGYGGELYLNNLNEGKNDILIDMLDQGKCRFSFIHNSRQPFRLKREVFQCPQI